MAVYSYEEIAKAAESNFNVWMDKLRPLNERIVREAKETMRNIGIASLSLAVGSIVLLDIRLPVVLQPYIATGQVIVILGILMALTNMILVFHTLVNRDINSQKEIWKSKNTYLDPWIDLMLLRKRVKNGLETKDKFAEEFEKVDKLFNAMELPGDFKILIDNEFNHEKSNRLIRRYETILAIATILVITGFIYPYGRADLHDIFIVKTIYGWPFALGLKQLGL